jgi:sirohydrochlorin cobaltochelatase
MTELRSKFQASVPNGETAVTPQPASKRFGQWDLIQSSEMSLLNQNSGLLLVGHGTRSRQGQEELLATAKAVGECSPLVVEPAFLEMARPSIDDGVARLAERGVSHVTVMPLLLFAAGHANNDIPQAVETAATQHGISIDGVASPLGCHECIVELSARRFVEAVGTNDAFGTTHLVMIGRGSNDAAATREMFRFTKLRAARTPVASAETCFVAMTEPLLDELLPVLDERIRVGRCIDSNRIVVQPHLLFHGELLTRIRERVDQFAAMLKDVDWVVTPHLGCDKLLVRAVFDVVKNCSPSKES